MNYRIELNSKGKKIEKKGESPIEKILELGDGMIKNAIEESD